MPTNPFFRSTHHPPHIQHGADAHNLAVDHPGLRLLIPVESIQGKQVNFLLGEWEKMYLLAKVRRLAENGRGGVISESQLELKCMWHTNVARNRPTEPTEDERRLRACLSLPLKEDEYEELKELMGLTQAGRVDDFVTPTENEIAEHRDVVHFFNITGRYRK